MPNPEIELIVNGKRYRMRVPVTRTLLEVLREELGLGGAREGCGIGVCGACTVLLDGKAVSSCHTLAVQAQGKQIVTVEGLSSNGDLHPLQQAFLDHAAFQCAYCTPGFILSAVALLNDDPNPDDEAISAYLAGNLCRCGSYKNILAAVRSCRRPE